MTFAEQLNDYMKILKCFYRNLVATPRLYSTVISRYRNGERTQILKVNKLNI